MTYLVHNKEFKSATFSCFLHFLINNKWYWFNFYKMILKPWMNKSHGWNLLSKNLNEKLRWILQMKILNEDFLQMICCQSQRALKSVTASMLLLDFDAIVFYLIKSYLLLVLNTSYFYFNIAWYYYFLIFYFIEYLLIIFL